ncbi:hypothetical protein DER46DRAFT_583530 [Fusarium sp. MPI-SDFR-AT-0072]|nr:hypothetical protein DER46DRAFT_583530 [Fusarium sp. MPI-SDFR-AT-0072]KAI7772772.1 hypothetical protein LZL87_005497 [Fusarium oxysporum]
MGNGRAKQLHFGRWVIISAIWPENDHVIKIAKDMSKVWGVKFPTTELFFPPNMTDGDIEAKWDGTVYQDGTNVDVDKKKDNKGKKGKLEDSDSSDDTSDEDDSNDDSDKAGEDDKSSDKEEKEDKESDDDSDTDSEDGKRKAELLQEDEQNA